MKLRNKLIPIMATLATTATIVPTLTSCNKWVRYTDLLNKEYKSGVKVHDKTIVYQQEALDSLYLDASMKNFDIIRDDILWTYSKLLHHSDAKAEIDKKIVYSKFIFDIHFNTDKVFILDPGPGYGEWKDMYVANIEAEVAGECTDDFMNSTAGLKDASNNQIKSFDFKFNVGIDGFTGVDITKKDPTPGNDASVPAAIKDWNRPTLNFDGAQIRISTLGSYKKPNVTEKVFVENNEVVMAASASSATFYLLFGKTTLSLFSLSYPNPTYDDEPTIRFASHYLENIEIKF